MSGEGVIPAARNLRPFTPEPLPYAIGSKDGDGAWSVLMVIDGPNATIRRHLTADEAEAFARDLQRGAALVRDPGGVPE